MLNVGLNVHLVDDSIVAPTTSTRESGTMREKSLRFEASPTEKYPKTKMHKIYFKLSRNIFYTICKKLHNLTQNLIQIVCIMTKA